jgi:hypothetical protein
LFEKGVYGGFNQALNRNSTISNQQAPTLLRNNSTSSQNLIGNNLTVG